MSAVVTNAVTSSGKGGFANLEWLNLAHNFIACEDDIADLVNLPRLQDVLLYGNPLMSAGRKRRRKHGMHTLLVQKYLFPTKTMSQNGLSENNRGHLKKRRECGNC